LGLLKHDGIVIEENSIFFIIVHDDFFFTLPLVLSLLRNFFFSNIGLGLGFSSSHSNHEMMSSQPS
jgi:predicted membrane-bound dolichyl-phosphate-mannose-protein mannosyltransferase